MMFLAWSSLVLIHRTACGQRAKRVVVVCANAATCQQGWRKAGGNLGTHTHEKSYSYSYHRMRAWVGWGWNAGCRTLRAHLVEGKRIAARQLIDLHHGLAHGGRVLLERVDARGVVEDAARHLAVRAHRAERREARRRAHRRSASRDDAQHMVL